VQEARASPGRSNQNCKRKAKPQFKRVPPDLCILRAETTVFFAAHGFGLNPSTEPPAGGGPGPGVPRLFAGRLASSSVASPSRLLPPYGEEQCARANGAGSRGTLHIGVSLARRFRPSSLPRPRSPTPRSLGSSSPRFVDSARNGFYCDACRWARPGACSYGSGRSSVYFWRPSQASSVLSLSLQNSVGSGQSVLPAAASSA